ncbi:MAG: hypothetical protein A2W19_05945 [Spirochaetes bacterium RBG_16_49_21]|nr:MAG: hypothetical protein A2W19_05945 [Spirochaetes bacterium RBG_16_49_21]
MAINSKKIKRKKSAGKPARKAAGKRAKKTAGKTAVKPARVMKISTTSEKNFPREARPFEEEYRSEDTALLQREGMREKKSGTRTAARTTVTIIIVLVIIAIGLFLSPEAREWINKYISIGGISKSRTAEEKKEITALPKAATEKESVRVPDEESANYYTVQVKDDLVSISEKLLHDYSKWKDVYQANRDIIKDPAIIYPGQKLKIPAKDKK